MASFGIFLPGEETLGFGDENFHSEAGNFGSGEG